MALIHRELVRSSVHHVGRRKFYCCCAICGEEHRFPDIFRCRLCRGPLDVFYNYSKTCLADHNRSIERYFELLPIKSRENILSLGEGSTRCVRSRELGRLLGLENLYFKDETSNPTRSTKDRMAAVVLSFFLEHGVTEFVVASTGNSSTAFARAIQKHRTAKMHAFAATELFGQFNYPDDPLTPTYLIKGDFVEAGVSAKRFAEDKQITWESGFFNPMRREGLKLAYFEAYDAIPNGPDVVFQAISSGMGLLAAYKGALEYLALGRLSKLPIFLGVQQDSCAPMAQAFQGGYLQFPRSLVVHKPQGLATSILRGDPTETYPYIRFVTSSTGGGIESVSEEEICEARELLHSHEGINACYSSATAFAGLIKGRRTGAISSDAKVLVNLTGGIREQRVVPEKTVSLASDVHRAQDNLTTTDRSRPSRML